MNDSRRERQQEREREMSHLAIGGLKLTANQFRCEKLAKYRAPMTFLRDEEERGRRTMTTGEERGKDGQRMKKEEMNRGGQKGHEKKEVPRTGK